jgi:hypothetical protein
MLNRWLDELFPAPDAQLTVSVGFDNKYLEYGKIFLRSIRQNSPRVKVIVLAVNQPAAGLAEFADWQNLTVIHEDREFAHPYEQRLYTMARRIFLVNELRQDPTVENLLQLDADSIVRRDLNRFGKLFAQGDFCIFARPTMKLEYLRLTMNVLGLANTKAAKALTQEWVQQLWEILAEPQDSKYIDQLTLWQAYDKVNQSQGVRLMNLDKPYIGGSGNTVIRTFYATKDARNNPKLLKELNQFTDQPLDDAPSNAPKKPEDEAVPLYRGLLMPQFEQALGVSADLNAGAK